MQTVTRFERVLNKIEQRIDRVSTKLSKDLDKTKPFDKEPVTDRDRYYQFTQLTPDQIQFARQNFGDMYVENYLANMGKLKERYANG